MNITKYRQWMGHKGAVYTLAALTDTDFVSAGSDGYIIRWFLDGDSHGEAIAQVHTQVFTSRYIHSLQLLLLGAMDGHLYVIELVKGKCIRNIDLKCGFVFCIEYDDDKIFVGTQSGALYIFSTEFEVLQMVNVADAALRSFSLVQQSNRLFIASSDKHVYALHTSSCKIISKWLAATHSVFSLAYSHKDETLYGGSRDARLYTYTFEEQGVNVKNIAAHMFTINDLCIDEDRQLLFSASRDKTIRIWEMPGLRLLKSIDQKFDAHRNSVNKLLYFPKRNLLISASDDRAVIGWNVNKT